MKQVLFLTGLTLLFNLFSPSRLLSQKEAVFKVVEKVYIPTLPGCEGVVDTTAKKCFDSILMKHIYKHLEYPALAREHKIEGTVVITFRIDPEDEIYCAKVLRDIGAGTGKAALAAVNQSLQELLKTYSPCKWQPTKSRGNPVNVQWNFPVKFKLDNKDLFKKD